MKTRTKYQTVIHDDKVPVLMDNYTPPTPPATGEEHGDVSVLGILGRVGVAARS